MQETEYAENGVDKKNITGYTEVGFYSLDGICTFTEQEQLQAAINPKRLTYRLQNSDQSKYIHVKFDGKPTAVGQKMKTEFSFQGVSFLKEGMEMEVVRIDGDKVWLSGDNVGIVIPVFNN